MSTNTLTQPRQNQHPGRLTEAVQSFIVQRLAMYDSPTAVAQLVKDEFGVELTRQRVHSYDADRSGKKPAQRWCALYDATRKRFVEELAGLAVAHRAVRIKRLDEMAVAAHARRNYVLARELLEQIAKEVGDLYVRRKGATGEKDDPVHFVFEPEVPPPVGANNRRDDDD